MFLDICYALVLAAVSPYLLWRAWAQGKYRDHWRERLGASPRRSGSRFRFWLHGVSLGEVRAARTLIPAIEAAFPGCEFVISTNTETGRAEAQKLYAPRPVFYYPLDFTGCVRSALDRARPDCVILMELEFWPNFTAECARRGIPIVLANGRITAHSAKGYARGGRVVSNMFNRGTRLCVQTAEYERRFVELGVRADKLAVIPSLKYDTADFSATVPGADELARDLGIAGGDEFGSSKSVRTGGVPPVAPDVKDSNESQLIVGGSTGPGEEAMLLESYKVLCERNPRVRLAIVPRHPQRFEEVARLIESSGLPMIRRSKMRDAVSAEAARSASTHPVILGDTMGELRKFYALGAVAFLGRSLIRAGGSDMTEAASLGKPTVFGPHVWNFEETAAALLDADAAVRVGSQAELTAAFAALLGDADRRRAMGERAAQALLGRRGGTAATVEQVRRAVSHFFPQFAGRCTDDGSALQR